MQIATLPFTFLKLTICEPGITMFTILFLGAFSLALLAAYAVTYSVFGR